MLEQKLIVGSEIVFRVPVVSPNVFPDWEGFVLINQQNFYLNESTGFFSKSSTVQPGGGPKAHRKFRWLPYLKHKVTITPLEEMDVLSGPFSGCWFITYRYNNRQWVAHIGTSDNNPLLSMETKNAWNNFAKDIDDTDLKGFNPFRCWTREEITPHAATSEETGPYFFGLATLTGDFFTFMVRMKISNSDKKRIVGMKKVVSEVPHILQAI